MKLLAKYNRISLVTTIMVMLVTGIVYYYVVSMILTHQVDKDLEVEENEILDYVRLNHQLPQIFNTNDQEITFKKVKSEKAGRRFINSTYWNVKEKEKESGRGLISSVMVNGTNFQITIIESKVETEDLIQIIFLITLAVIVLLLVVLFIINRLVIKRLWLPFYQILQQLKLFSLKDKLPIAKISSEIDEFNELNEAVTAMSQRVKDDYQELKTFTENASHELLTPVAIINSKLDTLLQTGDFSQRQSELIGDIYETVSRLTRLNKSMLLLTKIENGLINDQENLSIKDVLQELLIQFYELFSEKQIAVNTNLKEVHLQMSKSLLYVLLNNLLVNAIRHNIFGGEIAILLDEKKLVIRNTGREEPLEPSQIFKRFNKSSDSEGSGLGLTLSNQICDNYNFKLSYQYIRPFHSFTIYF